MLGKYWQDQLNDKLNRIPVDSRPKRLALVGVGNTLRGDDGIGVLLVRSLKYFFGEISEVCLLEAEMAPENITGQLRYYEPDFILFIDAAQMDELPGTVRVWSYKECGGILASTHTLPLNMLCAYLENELNCEIAILGIQPMDIGFGQGLSIQVEKSLKEIIPLLVVIICESIGMRYQSPAGSFEYAVEDFSEAVPGTNPIDPAE